MSLGLFQGAPGRSVVCSLMLLLAGGCSLLSKGKGESQAPNPSDELKITIKLDKEVYRPGEAVLAEVTVTNATEKPIKIRPLESRTLSFWFGPVGQDRRLEREPVVSQNEAQLEAEAGAEQAGPLAPGESRSRRFLHTRLTGSPGAFVALVHGDLFDELAKQAGRVYSEPTGFRVEGEAVFARDSAGLMMKEDAIRLAASQTPASAPKGAEARLILDEMGFYKWWINLDFAGEKQSWLIDPYLGRVWAKAQPFAPGQAEAPKPRVRGVEGK